METRGGKQEQKEERQQQGEQMEFQVGQRVVCAFSFQFRKFNPDHPVGGGQEGLAESTGKIVEVLTHDEVAGSAHRRIHADESHPRFVPLLIGSLIILAS